MNAGKIKLTHLTPIYIAFTGLFLANSFAIEAMYILSPVDNTSAVPLPVVMDIPDRQMFSLSDVEREVGRRRGKSGGFIHGD